MSWFKKLSTVVSSVAEETIKSMNEAASGFSLDHMQSRANDDDSSVSADSLDLAFVCPRMICT